MEYYESLTVSVLVSDMSPLASLYTTFFRCSQLVLPKWKLEKINVSVYFVIVVIKRRMARRLVTPHPLASSVHLYTNKAWVIKL